MSYKYVAYTADKRIVKGTIGVTSESMAEEALERAGYSIVSLREVRLGLSLEQSIPSLFGVKAHAVIVFSRQLATFIESGTSILTALQLLQEQTGNAAFRKVIAGLSEALQGGSSFSGALAKYPQAFSDTYCRLVEAGERSGNLEVVLRQATSYMEKGTAAMKKAKHAMVYPALVLIIAIAVVVLLITVALPPLTALFTSLGAELPWTTRALIAVSGFVTSYKFYLLGAVFALTVLIVWYVRRPAGRLMLDNLLLKVPLIGPINIQSNMSHLSRTMSMLLKAGLPLPQIMDIASQTTGNRIIRQALIDVRKELVQGHGLSRPMAAIKLFPRVLVQMVMVGEQTGTLDSNLATLADFYEEEVDQRVDTLISIIEPSLIVLVGLMVGFIALSLIMPMYSIMGSM